MRNSPADYALLMAAPDKSRGDQRAADIGDQVDQRGMAIKRQALQRLSCEAERDGD